MNIVIDGKYRVLSDGLGYSVKEITGENDDGKELSKVQGHFITLAGCVKRIFQLGHAGPDIDSVAALVEQMESQAARLEAFLNSTTVTVRAEVREASEFD